LATFRLALAALFFLFLFTAAGESGLREFRLKFCADMA
jgi:hypothetical protein